MASAHQRDLRLAGSQIDFYFLISLKKLTNYNQMREEYLTEIGQFLMT